MCDLCDPLLYYCYIFLSSVLSVLKTVGLVNQKLKIWSSFIHTHVVPNLN